MVKSVLKQTLSLRLKNKLAENPYSVPYDANQLSIREADSVA